LIAFKFLVLRNNQNFNLLISIFRDYEGIESSLLKSKYLNATQLFNKMIESVRSNRPNCEEVINDKHLWSLNDKDYDFEKELQFISKTSYIYSIIRTKLNNKT